MKLLSSLACIVALSACDRSATIHDQCIRHRIFQACVKDLPRGAAYNVYGDVVDQCASAAAYQALRQREHVKPECRP
jgi:hypothetical protein